MKRTMHVAVMLAMRATLGVSLAMKMPPCVERNVSAFPWMLTTSTSVHELGAAVVAWKTWEGIEEACYGFFAFVSLWDEHCSKPECYETLKINVCARMYSLMQCNWFSDITDRESTPVACLQWRQRTNSTAPGCTLAYTRVHACRNTHTHTHTVNKPGYPNRWMQQKYKEGRKISLFGTPLFSKPLASGSAPSWLRTACVTQSLPLWVHCHTVTGRSSTCRCDPTSQAV